MIHVEAVSKKISSHFSLKEISLDVSVGLVTALMGPNGSGKTSLVRLISGIYRPDSGLVKVKGLDAVNDSLEVRREIGIATDRLFLYPWLNVMEYLEHCASLYQLPPSEWRKRAENLLEFYGLSGYANKQISNLSNGMKQKLNLIRAVIHKPSVLLLDEPTLGLDPQAVRLLGEYLEEFTKCGGSVLLCSHDLSFVCKACHEVHFISAGEIVDVLDLQRMEVNYAIDVAPTVNEAKLKTECMQRALSVRVRRTEESGEFRVEYRAAKGDTIHGRVLSALHASQAEIVDYAARKEDALGERYELLVSER